MRLHKLLNLCLLSAPDQVMQEPLIAIEGMNKGAEFLRKRQRLTARTATGIDEDTKLLFRKKAQHMQGTPKSRSTGS
jgi:hypothetical protein